MKGWVLAAILVIAAASAACGGEGRAPAGPTSTPSPGASPSPSPTSVPSPSPTPEVIAGMPVVPLEVVGKAEFPDDVALIVETGCWQCDGPTTGLERVYRDPSRTLRAETLFSPEHLGLPPRVMQTDKGPQEEEPIITGFALTADASRIVVSVCTRGMCLEMGGPPSTDAQTTLFQSTDGGIIWRALDVLDGGFGARAITANRLLLIHFGGPYEGNGPRYQFHPSGETVEPPAGAVTWRPFPAPFGDLLWGTDDGRVLRTDGSEFLALDLPPSAEIIDLAVQPEPAPQTAVVWFEEEGASGSYYLGLVEPEGRFRKVYRTGDLVLLGGWLDALVYGNAGVQPERLPVPPPQFYLAWLPAALDLQGGAAAPILEPFLERQGRNLVQAIVEGPFARVVGTGSCLNVRAEPSMSSVVLACAADDVLLQDIGQSGHWLHVATPAGEVGWAAADYLER
jgi:hypothetical protein